MSIADASQAITSRRAMALEEAIPLLRPLCGVRVRDLKKQFPNRMVINKGSFGSTLESVIGMDPFSRSADFVNGELKTNKTLPNGQPKETIAVCVINTLVAKGLFAPRHAPYADSYVCKKLSNMLIVQVVKEGLEDDWYIHRLYHVTARPRSALHATFATDYRVIWQLVRRNLASDAEAVLHTTSGTYLQIRTKDGKPYHSIRCPHHDRVISEKNFAFYLKTDFMRAVVADRVPEAKLIS